MLSDSARVKATASQSVAVICHAAVFYANDVTDVTSISYLAHVIQLTGPGM